VRAEYRDLLAFPILHLGDDIPTSVRFSFVKRDVLQSLLPFNGKLNPKEFNQLILSKASFVDRLYTQEDPDQGLRIKLLTEEEEKNSLYYLVKLILDIVSWV
jgi:hypothetical protein